MNHVKRIKKYHQEQQSKTDVARPGFKVQYFIFMQIEKIKTKKWNQKAM
jgi:hypothetical protein